MSDTLRISVAIISHLLLCEGVRRPPPALRTSERFSGGGARPPPVWNLTQIHSEEEFCRHFRKLGQLPPLGRWADQNRNSCGDRSRVPGYFKPPSLRSRDIFVFVFGFKGRDFVVVERYFSFALKIHISPLYLYQYILYQGRRT